jgi:2-dehydro-3-deoxyphosphogluconate aldolase/(4S)-4-hydroxy-2-oxoglutarate aldolase
MDYTFLAENRIIPVAVFENAREVSPKLSALQTGGIRIAEITFRTKAAKEALRIALNDFPDMLIGAGTVVNAAQCESALEEGARFIVSPGFCSDAAKLCQKEGIPYLPGVVTPTEIISALDGGFEILKFFPAEASGGIKTLKALSAAFPDVRFVPTGGISEHNFMEYLSLKCVSAIGGSWMMQGTPENTEAVSRAAVKAVWEAEL